MNKHHFHRPNANLSCFQKSTFYAGIKIFNILSCCLAVLKKDKAKCEVALRQYLSTYTIYFADEFFMCDNDIYDCFVKS